MPRRRQRTLTDMTYSRVNRRASTATARQVLLLTIVLSSPTGMLSTHEFLTEYPLVLACDHLRRVTPENALEASSLPSGTVVLEVGEGVVERETDIRLEETDRVAHGNIAEQSPVMDPEARIPDLPQQLPGSDNPVLPGAFCGQ